MNILVITLGNSDIQIKNSPGAGFFIEEGYLKKEGLPNIKLRQNRNYSEFQLANPREGGRLIDKYYLQFKEALIFPLIDPLLALFKTEGVIFEEVWWVFTDQVDVDNFKDSDTLFFKSIIQKHFEECYSSVAYHDYPVTDRVKDIDYQYKAFYRKALSLVNRRDEIDKIFLLPQGGIDQINHALTLQLIQLFKEKVIVYQNAELSEPVQLQFTHLFLNDLTKHNVVKHVKDYDFDKATDLILDNAQLKALSQYAALRLNLAHSFINDNKVPKEYEMHWETISEIDREKIKISDLVYAFKVQMRQRRYNEALTKLYTIYENIFKIFIDSYTLTNTQIFYDKNIGSNEINLPWELFITEKIDPGGLENLKKKKVGKNSVSLNNPNSKTYFYLFRYLIANDKVKVQGITDEKIKKVDAVLNDLRNLRNSINHSLGSASMLDIEKVLEKHRLSIEEFYRCLDEFSNNKGMGIFESIRNIILASFGEMPE